MYDIATCSRCGSKNKIAKTWTQTIETKYGTKSKLTHTQWICTIKKCQKEFEAKLADDIEKRESMKMKNEAYAAKKLAAKDTVANGNVLPEKKITLK